MALVITNSFVAHTTAKSADVNQNFQDVQTWANNLSTWSAWTATNALLASDNVSVVAGTINMARYTQVGKTVTVDYSFSPTNFQTIGFNMFLIPPVAPAQDASASKNAGVGHFVYTSNTAGLQMNAYVPTTTYSNRIQLNTSAGTASAVNWTSYCNALVIYLKLVYEAA